MVKWLMSHDCVAISLDGGGNINKCYKAFSCWCREPCLIFGHQDHTNYSNRLSDFHFMKRRLSSKSVVVRIIPLFILCLHLNYLPLYSFTTSELTSERWFRNRRCCGSLMVDFRKTDVEILYPVYFRFTCALLPISLSIEG